MAGVTPEIIEETSVQNKTVTFHTDGFSIFGLAYTVDFHYNGIDYSIPGESQILLSELIEQLQIMNGDALLDVKDVAGVQFTDEHLVTVQEVSGLISYNDQEDIDVGEKDFLLSSKGAFSSEECLTIWLANGEPIVVGVTDAAEYWIYLEEGEKEVSLKALFEEHEELGTTLFDTIKANSSIYFFDSTGEYTWNYSYEIGTDITLKLLDSIPESDFISVSFYNWGTREWYTTSSGAFISICIQAPARTEGYHDQFFWYDLDTTDPDNIKAVLSGLYNKSVHSVQILSETADENRYPVIAVGENAFKENKTLNIVSFANDADMEVRGGAFQSMSGLWKVEFNGSGAVSIGKNNWDNVFGNCTSLTTVNGTGEGAVSFNTMGIYNGCSNLTTVNLKHIALIGQNTFIDNNSLKTVHAEKIDQINWQGFNRCRSLQLVHSGIVPSLSTNSFSGCNPEGVLTLQFDHLSNSGIRLGDVVRDSDGDAKHGKVALKISTESPISISSNIVDAYADLVSVEITGPVREIASEAFKDCTGLSGVSIGGSESDTVEVKAGAFSGCSALTSFTCSSKARMTNSSGAVEYDAGQAKLAWLSVEELDSETEDAEQLAADQAVIALADQGYTIEFYNIYLKDQNDDVIHESARVIWNKSISMNQANAGQSADVKLFHLSNNVVSLEQLESEQIEGKLTSFTFTTSFSPFALAYNIDRYHDETFYYELSGEGENRSATISGVYNKNETTISIFSKTQNEDEIPVTGIAANALKNNGSIVGITFCNDESFSAPENAFESMNALKSVSFTGDGLVTLGGSAFVDCRALETVTGTENASIRTESGYVFNNCSALTSVEFNGSAEVIEYNTFNNCFALTDVKLGSVGTLKGDAFKNSGIETFEVTGSIGTLNNAFSGSEQNPLPLKSFKVGRNVDSIPGWAFNWCTSLTSVEIGGDVGTILSSAFNECPSLEKLIILGYTGKMASYAVKSNEMRVAVFKGGIGSMAAWAFDNQPFGQDNNLIYVGSVGNAGSISGYAFGGSKQRGNGYFNVTYDQLANAVGGSPLTYLKLKNCHYSDQEYDENVYISENAYSYDYGTETEPFYDFSRAMGIIYYRTNDIDNFEQACEKAGVDDLGLVYNGNLISDFDGFVLHVMKGGVGRSQFVTKVTFPEDLYGNYVDANSLSDAPSKYKYIKGIVFEKDLTEISIPAKAMRNFPNLASVEVKNADALVTIGTDAFAGTKVNTICPAKQIVDSAAGTVTIEKEMNAPIGTALAMSNITGDQDSAVKAAGKSEGLFEDVDDALIQVKYFDVSLKAPNGTSVNVPAHVAITQKAEVYSGMDTIAPEEFGFFHLGDEVELVANDFTANEGSGLMAFEFNATGFSPYAAAYVLDAYEMTDGIYTYLVDKENNATIIGYGPDFTGNALNIPVETTIGELTCKVVGIKSLALVDPPEKITSVMFNNEEPIIVGSGAMSGLSYLDTIEFNGTANVEFKDGTAFDASGSGTVAVNMPNGLLAQTLDSAYGAVFSGITGKYILTVDNLTSIPAGAFKGDTKLAAITVLSPLEDIESISPEGTSGVNRGYFANSAIGTGAFEGATELESFTVSGNEDESFSIGNEAFKDCPNLTDLSLDGTICGIGENALTNTGLTNLTLDVEELYLGRNAIGYCPNLTSIEINGDVKDLGDGAFGGSGSGATKLTYLTFNGSVKRQMFDGVIRGEKLRALVFKGGMNGMNTDSVYTEEALIAPSLTVYIDGSYDENPYLASGECFPTDQKVRLYMNLPIAREDASSIREKNVVDLAYSLDKAPTDLYVDTNYTDDNQNGSAGAPFDSFEKALEATEKDYDHATRFKSYFTEAGYDPSNLSFTEGNFSMDGFTLHAVGGTARITDEFQGNEIIGGLEIAVRGDISIDPNAFKDCENLKSVTAEEMDGSIQIGTSAFEDCAALEELIIGYYSYYYSNYNMAPNLEIGVSAFKNCTSLPEFAIENVKKLNIGSNAFEGCSKIKKVNIPHADSVSVSADAFIGTALKEVDISTSSDVTLGENALKGVGSLTTVTVNSNSGSLTIEPGAMAGCGETEAVRLKGSNAPLVKAGAFDRTSIGVLLVESGASAVEAGGFSGGTSYVDGSNSFDFNLAERIGSFDNIILNNAQFVDVNAQVFGENDSLKNVYLGRESATNGGTKGMIFAGMPDSAVAYVAHRQAEFIDENRPDRKGGALRFLDADEYPYIDGTNTNPNPDGSRSNGFSTFEQAKEYASSHATNSTGDGTSIGDYYFTGVAEALRKAFGESGITYKESDIRFSVPSDQTDYQVFYVIGTLPVNTDQTWDSPEGMTITLLRYDGGNTGAGSAFVEEFANVQGASLTLNNVVLDGNCTDSREPLVLGNSSSTIVIHDYAQLRNNINTEEQWIDNQYVSGGAIRTNGRVVMDGGSISGNTAVGGGGINIHGGSFEMNGGTISSNTVQAGSSSDSHIMGGGVLVTGGARMTFSDGSVCENMANGGNGAGIALGSSFFGNNNNIGYLTMTGGSISGNESTYEGGGLYIQMESSADVSGGSITGNICHGGRFSPNYGGGGIYVNGTHEFFRGHKDGVLHLSKAVIKRNDADVEGGALSACLTSTSRIYLASGSAIYGNQAGDGADVHCDYFGIMSWEGYGTVYGTMEATISPYMWNGTPYNWINAETNKEFPVAELAMIKGKTIHLRANPGEGAPSSGNVLISGNHSDSRGGGIGSNGTIIIGDEPEAGEAEWIPDVSKVLHNRDMMEGETFTFDLYREDRTATGTGTYTFGSENMRYTYTDTYLGTGTVTGGKKDVPSKVSFEPVTIQNLTAADIGSIRTYLVLETTPSGEKLITDTKNYLAFYVTIGMGVRNGKEYYTAQTTDVLKGQYSLDGNGKPVFNAGAWYGEKDVRIRDGIHPDEAVFHNYFTEIDVSADKSWINYDGPGIPPAGTKVTFELYADGKPFSLSRTIELDGEKDSSGEFRAWTATWKDLPAYRTNAEGDIVTDKRGEYVKVAYSVKEVGIVLPEGSYASYENEAESALVSTTGTKPASILNRQLTGDLSISKTTISDAEADKDRIFSFIVSLSDQSISHTFETDIAGRTVRFTNGQSETIELKGGESLTINGLPRGVGYSVTEAAADGFRLTGKTGDEGIIRSTKAEAKFENSRETGDLEVSKTVSSIIAVDQNAEFQFAVTLTGLTGEAANKTYGDMRFADGKAVFTLKHGESKKATGLPTGIVYTVEEKPVDGYTALEDWKTGTITTRTSNAAFVNTYNAEGDTTLTAEKQIEGRTFQKGDRWTFTVTAEDDVPMPEKTSVTISPTEGRSAQIDFGKISYTEKDVDKTYTYTITETGTVAGVTNDSAKTVTVKVTDNGDGTLNAENSISTEPLTFVNTYHPTGKAQLRGHKVIQNRPFAKDDTLKVTITADEGVKLPEITEIDVPLKEGEYTAEFVFGEIDYELSDLGGETEKTFVYTITETAKMAGTKADTGTHTATVKVKLDSQGLLLTEVTYSDGEEIEFVNPYTEGKGRLTIEKVFDIQEKPAPATPEVLPLPRRHRHLPPRPRPRPLRRLRPLPRRHRLRNRR